MCVCVYIYRKRERARTCTYPYWVPYNFQSTLLRYNLYIIKFTNSKWWVLIIHVQFCHYDHNHELLEYFYHFSIFSCVPLQWIFPTPPVPALSSPNLLSVAVMLPFLQFHRNGLSCTYFFVPDPPRGGTFQTRSCCCMCQYFVPFLLLSSVPWWGRATIVYPFCGLWTFWRLWAFEYRSLNGHNVLHFLGLTPMSKVARSGGKCTF